MKIPFIILLLAFVSVSCSSSKKIPKDESTRSKYYIEKIQSKNSWHIIYASKQDSLYKIVVKKESKASPSCNKIAVKRYYNLDLKSRRENVPVINGIRLKPVNHLDVESNSYNKDGIECYIYDKDTEICAEPENGIFDVHFTTDINGLCYMKSTE